MLWLHSSALSRAIACVSSLGTLFHILLCTLSIFLPNRANSLSSWQPCGEGRRHAARAFHSGGSASTVAKKASERDLQIVYDLVIAERAREERAHAYKVPTRPVVDLEVEEETRTSEGMRMRQRLCLDVRKRAHVRKGACPLVRAVVRRAGGRVGEGSLGAWGSGNAQPAWSCLSLCSADTAALSA